MKKKQITLSVSQFFVIAASFASQLSDKHAFTLIANKNNSNCGLYAENDKACLKEKFIYTVKGPGNGLNAFVDITYWEVGLNKYTPKNTMLENIGYLFGTVGRAIEFDDNPTKKRCT